MAKGSSFEREIAQALSLWWSGGKNDNVFYRSQASGGRFTSRWKRGKKTVDQGGDITSADPEGREFIEYFSIECKTGYASVAKIKNQDGSMATKTVKSKAKGMVVKELSEVVRWDVLDIIDSKQKEPVLMKMWAQCSRDAEIVGKQPLLIFRRNRRMPCIMFEKSLMAKMQEYYGDPQNVILRVDGLCIMLLNDFFQWIPDMRLIIREGEKK